MMKYFRAKLWQALDISLHQFVKEPFPWEFYWYHCQNLREERLLEQLNYTRLVMKKNHKCHRLESRQELRILLLKLKNSIRLTKQCHLRPFFIEGSNYRRKSTQNIISHKAKSIILRTWYPMQFCRASKERHKYETNLTKRIVLSFICEKSETHLSS